MEEKVIIKSKQYDIAKFRKICLILGVMLFAVVFVVTFSDDYVKWGRGLNVFEFFIRCFDLWWTLGIPLVCGAVPVVIGIIVYAWLSKVEMIVTAERVYGTAAFGTRVDLPFDSISAIGAGWLNSIAVSTSSGRISFFAIKNRDEIHDVISKLLIERQHKSKPIAAQTVKQEPPQSNADELKKYKELLDMGVITKEEFDEKKKQLLGL